MKFATHSVAVLCAGGALLLGACGKSGEPTAAQSEHEEREAGGVAFEEGHGLKFTPEIIRALELKSSAAEERPIASELIFTAHVFKTSPDVLASVSLSPAEAERLQTQNFSGARLVRVDRSSESATGRVDAVFAVDRTPAPVIGDFVSLSLQAAPRTVLTVPRSALLDSATGHFVYVAQGEFYLRTAVKVGARSADFIEITDGLHVGDRVVAASVEQLWLAELRLTKGGGHSH